MNDPTTTPRTDNRGTHRRRPLGERFVELLLDLPAAALLRFGPR